MMKTLAIVLVLASAPAVAGTVLGPPGTYDPPVGYSPGRPQGPSEPSDGGGGHRDEDDDRIVCVIAPQLCDEEIVEAPEPEPVVPVVDWQGEREPPLTPIPLPAGGVLLASALGLLIWRRGR